MSTFLFLPLNYYCFWPAFSVKSKTIRVWLNCFYIKSRVRTSSYAPVRTYLILNKCYLLKGSLTFNKSNNRWYFKMNSIALMWTSIFPVWLLRSSTSFGQVWVKHFIGKVVWSCRFCSSGENISNFKQTSLLKYQLIFQQ